MAPRTRCSSPSQEIKSKKRPRVRLATRHSALVSRHLLHFVYQLQAASLSVALTTSRLQEEADSSGGNEAWASIDVNPATLFVGNTESGFMGLEVRVCTCE